jgi:hypothetical protein
MGSTVPRSAPLASDWGAGGAVLLSDLPDVLTVEEAAAVLRIGRNAAYELTHRADVRADSFTPPILGITQPRSVCS